MLQILLGADPRAQVDRAIAWLGAPGGDPLATDTLVVPTPAVGHWIEHRLAAHTGISANLRIERPLGFLWRELASQLPGTSQVAPFEASRVRWAIFAALDELTADGASTSASAPLLQVRWREASDIERVRFAERLALQFDRYQNWRRDWTQRWAHDRVALPDATTRHDHEPWQRWLWQEILKRVKGYSSEHPLDRLRREHRTNGKADSFATFGGAADPEAAHEGQGPDALVEDRGRVVLYGMLSLSPEHYEAIALLCRERPVLWLATDPAIGFWDDFMSASQAARLARDNPANHVLFEAEPALLGQWGRETRTTLAIFRELEQNGLAVIADSALRDGPVDPSDESSQTRLGRLQRAIIHLSDEPWAELTRQAPLRAEAAVRDPSLEVHACHSLARQADVVYDRLMAAFAEIADLQADDVAVFCVDADAAMPWLQARFDADPVRALPVAALQQAPRHDPAVVATTSFFTMVLGEVTSPVLFDWLHAAWFRRRFGLSEEALEALQHALDAAAWRFDDLGAAQAHPRGWRAAMASLSLGICYEQDELQEPEPGLACGPLWPVGIAHGEAEHILEVVSSLIAEIVHLRTCTAVAPVQFWIDTCESLWERWFAGDADMLGGISRIRAATAELAQQLRASGLTEITFAVFVEGLRTPLEQGARLSWPKGAITVAPVGAMRGIAFRVVAVMGLDDGAWPPHDSTLEYDLMKAAPRFADPSAADTARGVFLDLVRETGDRLLLTYSGLDARDNSRRPPARPVAELCDYLAGVDPLWPASSCRFEHPLQPYSPQRYRPGHSGNMPPSFDAAWLEAASVLAQDAVGPVIGLAVAGASEAGHREPVVATVDDMVRVQANPQRAYLRAMLGAAVPWIADPPEELEILGQEDLDYQQTNDLRALVSAALRQGRNVAECIELLRAHPKAPAGLAVAPAVTEWVAEISAEQAVIEAVLSEFGLNMHDEPPRNQRAVRVQLNDGARLVGALPPVWQINNRLMAVDIRSGIYWADFVRAWCHYLFWLASDDFDGDCSWLMVASAQKRTDGEVLGWGPGVDRLRAPSDSNGAEANAEAPWGDISSLAREALSTMVNSVNRDRTLSPFAYPRLAFAWLDAGGVSSWNAGLASALQQQASEPGIAGVTKEIKDAYLCMYGDGYTSPGLLERPESRAIWRAEKPTLAALLPISLARYAPIFMSARGNLPLAEAIQRWQQAWTVSA